jgi:hypothetical protein
MPGAARRTNEPRAKNVLIVLEQGDMSHLDTWDPKPDVATDHRSPFKPVNTNIPGIQFTELLSRTARIDNKLAVVRSMIHPKSGAGGHPKGTQYMLSGSHPSGPIEMPDIGSIVEKIREANACSFRPTSWCPATASRPWKRERDFFRKL